MVDCGLCYKLNLVPFPESTVSMAFSVKLYEMTPQGYFTDLLIETVLTVLNPQA